MDSVVLKVCVVVGAMFIFSFVGDALYTLAMRVDFTDIPQLYTDIWGGCGIFIGLKLEHYLDRID